MESKVTVLLYHHVGEPLPGSWPYLSTSASGFVKQMEWLRAKGYRSITLFDLSNFLRNKTPLPERTVLISFDDAFADCMTQAFPAILSAGFSAVVFVPTLHLGGTNAWDEKSGFAHTYPLMTVEHIREWSQRGIEFGSHSRTHADLCKLPESELEKEIAGSRDDLQQILGKEVVAFAYPRGRMNDDVCRHVSKSYLLGFSTESGRNSADSNPFALRRTQPLPDESNFMFGIRVKHGWAPRDWQDWRPGRKSTMLD